MTLLMTDEKCDELVVQKQSYDVRTLPSPQPRAMSRTMVLRGRSAQNGKAEYSVTWSMKMEVGWVRERERGRKKRRVREVLDAMAARYYYVIASRISWIVRNFTTGI